MEEQKQAQTITVIMTSSVIQSIKLDLFNFQDSLKASQILKNYQQVIFTLPQELTYFYCIASSENSKIIKQFEVRVPKKEENLDKFQICKNYGSFELKMEILLADLPKVAEQKVQIDIENTPESQAHRFIKKIEQTIFKKIEIEQFKRSTRTKDRSTWKKTCLRKNNKNFTAVFSKANSNNQYKLCDSSGPTMETMISFSRFKMTEQTNQGDDVNRCSEATTKSKNQYVAYLRDDICDFQQIHEEESHVLDKISQVLVTNKNIEKKKRLRIIQKSYFRHLEDETRRQLSKQKQALSIVKTVIQQYSKSSKLPEFRLTKTKPKKKEEVSPYFSQNSRLKVLRMI